MKFVEKFRMIVELLSGQRISTFGNHPPALVHSLFVRFIVAFHFMGKRNAVFRGQMPRILGENSLKEHYRAIVIPFPQVVITKEIKTKIGFVSEFV